MKNIYTVMARQVKSSYTTMAEARQATPSDTKLVIMVGQSKSYCTAIAGHEYQYTLPKEIEECDER